MIQMTLIQIDNYGPWTVTPRPRTESDLQILQAELFADVQRLIAAKKGLVFFTRFDNLLAVTNGLNEEDHMRIQRSIRNRYPITISMGVGAAETPHEAQKLATIALQKAGSAQSGERKEILAIDVKRGLEQREFLLSNDKEFHMQIHSIKRVDKGGGKHFSYESSRDERGHADSFWAWALANAAVVTTENKSNNFYAQRRKKRQELMQEKPVERIEKVQKTLEETQDYLQEVHQKQAQKDFGEAAVITRGKSLRQINSAFGYDKPSKDRW